MKPIIISLILLIPVFVYSQETDTSYITYNNQALPLYPITIAELPDIPSPFISDDGVEVLIAFTKDKKFLLFPVTIENGDTLNYKQPQYGKGFQCKVDSTDFPTLAHTGLHEETELVNIKTITGKSISQITEIGRPMGYSRAGFMSQDEDIISVLKNDNLLVSKLNLSHPQVAKPLFHIWNIVLQGIKRDVWLFEQMRIEYILYNGRNIFINWQGGRGWQESIFNDEILGQYHLQMLRELDTEEETYLLKHYAYLNKQEMIDLKAKLSSIHCGEMVPYYIMRYGFYEGHTEYRADPITISFIFGLKSIKEIDDIFKGKLYYILTEQYTSE